PHNVLLSQGWVSQEGYVEALARHLGARTPAGAARPEPSAILIVSTKDRPLEVARRAKSLRQEGREIVLVSQARLEEIETAEQKARRARKAVAGLVRWSPVLPAGSPVWSWQLLALTIGAGLAAGTTATAPDIARQLAFALLTVLFLPVVALRVAISCLSLARRPAGDRPDR